MVFGGDEPRALPWAGMNDAFGVLITPAVADRLFLSASRNRWQSVGDVYAEPPLFSSQLAGFDDHFLPAADAGSCCRHPSIARGAGRRLGAAAQPVVVAARGAA